MKRPTCTLYSPLKANEMIAELSNKNIASQLTTKNMWLNSILTFNDTNIVLYIVVDVGPIPTAVMNTKRKKQPMLQFSIEF